MNAPDPERTVGRRVDLLTTDGRLWGRGQAVGHFDFPSYVVDLEDGRGRTGWAAHLTRLTADDAPPPVEGDHGPDRPVAQRPQTTWAVGETVEADALADLHPDTRLVQSVNGFPAGAPRTVRDLSRSSWRHSARFVIVYLPPRGQPPADHASELLALAAAVANLNVHLGMVGGTEEQQRAYHVARVEALRDIEIRLRELAADPDGEAAAREAAIEAARGGERRG